MQNELYCHEGYKSHNIYIETTQYINDNGDFHVKYTGVIYKDGVELYHGEDYGSYDGEESLEMCKESIDRMVECLECCENEYQEVDSDYDEEYLDEVSCEE